LKTIKFPVFTSYGELAFGFVRLVLTLKTVSIVNKAPVTKFNLNAGSDRVTVPRRSTPAEKRETVRRQAISKAAFDLVQILHYKCEPISFQYEGGLR
jgi:hypothetical protein